MGFWGSISIFRHDDRGYYRHFFGGGGAGHQCEVRLPEIKPSLRVRLFVLMTGGTLGIFFFGGFRGQWEVRLPETKQNLRVRFFVMMTGGTLGIFLEEGGPGINVR